MRRQEETLRLELPPKLIPVFMGQARVRGAYGGRGSGKTRTFAKMAAVMGLKAAIEGREGVVLCGREYMNSLDDSSLAEVKGAIASDEWLSAGYDVGEKYVRTRDGRVHFVFAGLRHNLASIKSKARILLCWVDEAEPVTDEAWSTLIPTIREEESELWLTWNPDLEGSATDKRFRNAQDDDMKIVEMNWRDNPWFPSVLETERQRDKRDRPQLYPHIWEGAYSVVTEGAYYAADLLAAQEQGRIRRVAADPLMTLWSFHDIGGSSLTADAYAIWIAQFIDNDVRVLDYYESRGQSLGFHVEWMRKRGYQRALIQLPHDGVNENNITAKRYADHWRDAQFEVPEPIKNQGRGAAMQRVHASRRVFPRIIFNNASGLTASGDHVDDCTAAGRKALGRYHAHIDKERRIDLGPYHGPESNGADAFGLMCICAPEQETKKPGQMAVQYGSPVSRRWDHVRRR